jgi:hypothetical protein
MPDDKKRQSARDKKCAVGQGLIQFDRISFRRPERVRKSPRLKREKVAEKVSPILHSVISLLN